MALEIVAQRPSGQPPKTWGPSLEVRNCADASEPGLSRHGVAATIEYVHFEARIHSGEALMPPVGDGPDIFRGVIVGPGRHPRPIRAHVNTVEVLDPHAETLDLRNAILDAANSRHILCSL